MDQLKRLRREKGLSQAKLAALADVDPSTVNQIERGAREASPATLRKLAEALDVSLYELIEGEPRPLEQPRLPDVAPGEAYFVPLEESEEEDKVEIRIYYVRLLEGGEPILQAMREASPEEEAAIRRQLEKAGRARE